MFYRKIESRLYEYYHADYVENGNKYGVTYFPEYSKTLPKVDVELIVKKIEILANVEQLIYFSIEKK